MHTHIGFSSPMEREHRLLFETSGEAPKTTPDVKKPALPEQKELTQEDVRKEAERRAGTANTDVFTLRNELRSLEKERLTLDRQAAVGKLSDDMEARRRELAESIPVKLQDVRKAQAAFDASDSSVLILKDRRERVLTEYAEAKKSLGKEPETPELQAKKAEADELYGDMQTALGQKHKREIEQLKTDPNATLQDLRTLEMNQAREVFQQAEGLDKLFALIGMLIATISNISDKISKKGQKTLKEIEAEENGTAGKEKSVPAATMETLNADANIPVKFSTRTEGAKTFTVVERKAGTDAESKDLLKNVLTSLNVGVQPNDVNGIFLLENTAADTPQKVADATKIAWTQMKEFVEGDAEKKRFVSLDRTGKWQPEDKTVPQYKLDSTGHMLKRSGASLERYAPAQKKWETVDASKVLLETIPKGALLNVPIQFSLKGEEYTVKVLPTGISIRKGTTGTEKVYTLVAKNVSMIFTTKDVPLTIQSIENTGGKLLLTAGALGTKDTSESSSEDVVTLLEKLTTEGKYEMTTKKGQLISVG